jgi:AmmeMemoRadiSam system protein B/AmmeMemoRadiSam system protein A
MNEPKQNIRPAAVAGSFYPGTSGELQFQLDRMLTAAYGYTPPGAKSPKAIIVPHAGYVYSGQIAASVYARLKPFADRIRRVILIGPAHRVAFQGLAVPSSSAFATPLGLVSIDQDLIRELKVLPYIVEHDEAHRLEHSLETQLPFLQEVLNDFKLTPIVVGASAAGDLSDLLEQVWGGDETLIVISSDLSHYHDYDAARRIDGETCRQIEALNTGWIVPDQACGARGINALLTVARRHDLRATTLDLKNSGDTAGTRDRVVGYGAWSFTDNATTEISIDNRNMLLSAALRSIRFGMAQGRRPTVRLGTFEREIECVRACFITLQKDGQLRGCIGSLMPHRPLVEDVVWNAFAAAFEDSRFKPVTSKELNELDLSIAILGVPHDFPVASEADLAAQLRPHVDGLILQQRQKQALFLPHVWEQLPEPMKFIRHLKQKAGIASDEWSDDIQVQRFSTENFGKPVNEIKLI